ncbi:MAG TPA: thioesterase family protein [Polyangiales bacterium]
MDTQLTSLSTALQLRGSAPRFEASIPEDWAQGRATFGGLIAALGIRALARTVDAQHSLRSFVIDFAGPTEPGEVQIEVEPLRAGRSLTHSRGRLSQAGQVRAEIVGAFGATRATTLHLVGEPPPRAAAPEEAIRLSYIEGVMPKFTQHFDYRWTSDCSPFSAAARGHVGGWVRPLDDEPVDAAVLAALTDSFPAAIVPMMQAPAPNSTVTWLVNFVGRDLTAAPRSFWRLEGETDAVGDGYASEHAKLWDANGELRVISHQLVAEFS